MNTLGSIFRITSFGESHGKGIGVVIDGCPSGIILDMEFIQSELDRRKPGQNRISSQRKESDKVEILSGAVDFITTGAPLTLWVRNKDARPLDYSEIQKAFRPSHADYTYFKKYHIRDEKGGGRSSARETISRVAAGAVARLLLRKLCPELTINAWVSGVGPLEYLDTPTDFSLTTDFCRAVQCPDIDFSAKAFEYIDEVRKSGDSTGGIIRCQATGVPAGLGEPVFGKLHALLGAAMLSINAVKGFEYGSGFEGTKMKGSQHNDLFYSDSNKEIHTRSNFSGGIQGGISNGEPICFRVAFKPTATIFQPQTTVNTEGEEVVLMPKGRHDPCVVPRAVPIVEAMTALVLADMFLLDRIRRI